MPEPDSHLVGEADVETFDRDEVICLRGLFDARWVSRIRAAMDRVIANPSAEGKLLNPDGTPGRFERDLFMWMRDDDFRALVYDSPLGEIAAACMRSQRVTFIVDMMLTKEPNTPWPTPWHHDLPYGWYDGEQVCGLWLSLDHTTEDSGAVDWVRGSHKWGSWYAAQPFEGGAYEVPDGLERMPDIDADRSSYDIANYETEPGDCIVNHLLTVHSAPGNSTERRRRAVIFRLAGDDATYAERGPGRPKPFSDPGLAPGDPFPLDHDQFPTIWPKRDVPRVAASRIDLQSAAH